MSDNRKFKVGDTVGYRDKKSGKLYKAVVQEIVGDSCFRIKWQDLYYSLGDVTMECPKYFELVEMASNVDEAFDAYVAARREYLAKVDEAIEAGREVDKAEAQIIKLREAYHQARIAQTGAREKADAAYEALNAAIAQARRS